MSLLQTAVLVRPKLFSPLDLPGLVGWWDASQIPGLTDGDSVTTWADQSGNGNDLTQSTASKKPLWIVDVAESHSAVRSDGTDDKLVAASSASLNITGDEITLCIATKKPSTTTHGLPIAKRDFSDPGVRQQYQVYWNKTTEKVVFQLSVGSALKTLTSTNAHTDTTGAHIITAIYDGADQYLYFDGVADGSRAQTGDIDGSAYPLNTGSDGHSSYSDHDNLGIIICNTALNARQRKQTERFMADKRAIAITL